MSKGGPATRHLLLTMRSPPWDCISHERAAITWSTLPLVPVSSPGLPLPAML